MKIIYRAINKLTGKSYVGATLKTLESRIKDHIQKARKKIGGEFQEAIRTYGADAFEWVQIDTANSIDELAEKEKEYIIKYNAKENGYNVDGGGGFKKTIYQYDPANKHVVQKYDSLNSAAMAVNATKQDISRACLSANGFVYGYFWSYKNYENFIPNGDSRKKGVIQLDMKNKLVKEFDSVAEASEETGLSKTCISRVCRGERDSSGGFIWNYLDSGEY